MSLRPPPERLLRTVGWLGRRVDPLGDPTAAIETVSVLDSYSTSLMPRTSVHQGLAAGVHVLAARYLGSRIDAVQRVVLGAGAPPIISLGGRAVAFAVGVAAGRVPARPDETLWRSGLRAGGTVVRAAAVSGALHDLARLARSGDRANPRRALTLGIAITGGATFWAARGLRHRRSVIPRWPVEQRADLLPSLAVGSVLSFTGMAAAGAYRLTGRGWELYFGQHWGRTTLARVVNGGMWGALAVAAYNAGIAAIGRTNERIEPSYADAPTSPLVSGSAESLSSFEELGMQGRRFVTDVVQPATITEVTGDEALDPIRVYVGFNSMPLYGTGRAELALAELERTGAYDRSHLLLVSPTGTGWVDQTVVEAAEFLARGDIATCAIQYGRFPSFLAVQKVGLGRIQFRLLLLGIRQRLMERPAERRPRVLVFGESLGAWTASDVVMSQGISGFDHYGIDRALWVGLPALAKWSRNGMAAGANELVPEGTVRVFDRHEQLAALDDDARQRLRAVILSHDNDPIAALRPELMIREPEWLRGERGRNVPDDMPWTPVSTFLQVMIDAANAMVTVPGEFESFGHDYRGDTTRFVRDAFHLPATTEEQAVRIEDALRRIDVERKQRLGQEVDEADVPAPFTPSTSSTLVGGIPFGAERTRGARWFR